MAKDRRFHSGAADDESVLRAGREDSEERDTTQDRELADNERLDELLENLVQEALPDIPPMEGFHVCWLSTTNTYDTIVKRMRLGYVPIKPEEIPEMKHLDRKGGQHEGMISFNEMVAYKIPMERYQRIMQFLHHRKPIEDEQAIYDSLEERLRDEGRDVALTRDVGDGIHQLGELRRAPRFAG